MSLGGPGAIEWTSSEEDSVNRQANEMVRAELPFTSQQETMALVHR